MDSERSYSGLDDLVVKDASFGGYSNVLGLDKPHIAIAGLIGIGKSVLAEALSTIMDVPLFKENVKDNDVLKLFYLEMQKYSFQLQMSLINERTVQIQKLLIDGKGGIQDRTIYEDMIFATALYKSGLMMDTEYDVYSEAAKRAFQCFSRPSFVVYLVASPETCMKRIKERGREMEKNITLEYLTSLNEEYESFFQKMSRTATVIRVNWENYGCPSDAAKEDTFEGVSTVAQKIAAVYRNPADRFVELDRITLY